MKKHPSSRNRDRIESDDLLRKLMELLLAYRGMIRLTVLKNIALVTYALITLYHGARGGNGWLSKAALGRFKINPGQLLRYSVLYHSQKKEPLDLIIYFGKGYQDPWYLLVPSGTSLTAEEIVELYAKRMSIEQGFRDWKTHLGGRN